MTSFTFKPAATFTERAGLFIALVGGTNSGKTFSALRLARGIAGPQGKIAVLDTEGGRTLHLKEQFSFDVSLFDPPFVPERFSQGAIDAEAAAYDALVIDSYSMEWVGLGGVLDWQAAEHKKMGGNDNTKGASWIKPKMAHKAMVYSLLQRRIPIIFSIRGEETFVPPKTTIFKPVTNKAFPFEVTVSFRLESDRKGFIDLSDPKAWKMEGAHEAIFRHGDRISEDHGAALAAWARGAPIQARPLAEREKQPEPKLFGIARGKAAEGSFALSSWKAKLTERQQDALLDIDDELNTAADEADERIAREQSASPHPPEDDTDGAGAPTREGGAPAAELRGGRP